MYNLDESSMESIKIIYKIDRVNREFSGLFKKLLTEDKSVCRDEAI